MSDYTPRPGTVAYRAIGHLESLGDDAEVLGSDIGAALGVSPLSILPCLEAALKAGVVTRRQKLDHARAPFWWRLARGTDAAPATNGATAPASNATAAAVSPAADGSQKPDDAEAIPRARAGRKPKGIAGAARRPETVKETSHRGAAHNGAAEDAKHDGGPAIPRGLDECLCELCHEAAHAEKDELDWIIAQRPTSDLPRLTDAVAAALTHDRPIRPLPPKAHSVLADLAEALACGDLTTLVAAQNRLQDLIDEQVDFRRGPGGSWREAA